MIGFGSIYTASNTATKIDTYTKLADKSDFCYIIYDVNGIKVMKIEDLATILKGTSSHFDVKRDVTDYVITDDTDYTGNNVDFKETKEERPMYNSGEVRIVQGDKSSSIEAYDIDGGRYFAIDDLIELLNIDSEFDAEQALYTFKNETSKKSAYVSLLSEDKAREVITAKANNGVVIDPNKPMLALTFDDGPKAGNTERIVEALKKTNSRATFFVVGQMVELHPELVQLAYDAGCQIGNHTYSHLDLKKLSPDDVKSQIYKTSNLVYNITGEYTMAGRPPYGSINDTVRETISIPWFNWNIDTLDWKYRDAAYVKKYVLENASDGSVILMHDLHSTTADAMVETIPELVNRGYQLVTMDELVEYKYGGDVTKVPGYVK